LVCLHTLVANVNAARPKLELGEVTTADVDDAWPKPEPGKPEPGKVTTPDVPAGNKRFGEWCTSSSECISGLCGTSCSARDYTPEFSVSCMCPCNGEVDLDEDGNQLYCCCGCVPNTWHANNHTVIEGGPKALSGRVTNCEDLDHDQDVPRKITACVNSDATVPGETGCDELPQPDPVTMAWASFNQFLEDDNIDIDFPPDGIEDKFEFKGVECEFAFQCRSRQKEFGQPCSTAKECKSHICGSGCDCPSELEPVCSCQAPCNYPAKCCGGCFINDTMEEVPCPLNLENKSDEPVAMEWYPGGEPDGYVYNLNTEKVTPELCYSLTTWYPKLPLPKRCETKEMSDLVKKLLRAWKDWQQ